MHKMTLMMGDRSSTGKIGSMPVRYYMYLEIAPCIRLLDEYRSKE